MSDNGFYRASLTHEEHPHPETSQMDMLFRVTPGAAAQVGVVTVRVTPVTPKARSKTLPESIPATA